MKVLAIVGSPRKKGNTDILMDATIKGVEKYGIEVEKIYLSDLHFKACIGCEACSSTYKCILKDDMQIVYTKFEESQGLILGSPTYFYNVSALTKSFIDRLYVYDIFDKEDRSVWLSPNEIFGIKYAVTIAVCEQENEEDMGVTSSIMQKTLTAIGVRCVDSIKALHLFKKGEALEQREILKQAEKSGEKLAKTLHLANVVKNGYTIHKT